jgi:hypothetical protein
MSRRSPGEGGLAKEDEPPAVSFIKSIRKAGRQERISTSVDTPSSEAPVPSSLGEGGLAKEDGQGAIIKKVANIAAVMDISGMKLLKRFARWLESILAPHPKNESDDDWSRRIW